MCQYVERKIFNVQLAIHPSDNTIQTTAVQEVVRNFVPLTLAVALAAMPTIRRFSNRGWNASEPAGKSILAGWRKLHKRVCQFAI
jgi:hypothetical protein